jgi:hypothetical protein
MKFITNYENHKVVRLEFKNGWTVSLVSRDGFSELATWPTCKSSGTEWTEHTLNRATDDEVAMFLYSVSKRKTYNPHHQAEITPHHIPHPSDDTISGDEIRRELTEIRSLIMSQTEALNTLTAQVEAIGTAVTSAVAELHDLATKVAELTSNGVVDDSNQLGAISDQLRTLAATLTQGVADAAGTPAPAPVEPTPETPAV